MATSMVSGFTSADRRKKIVTYGRSSRLSIIPEPSPSPERPRKQPTTSHRSLKGSDGTAQPTGGSASVSTRNSTPDIFDVPSDDDFALRPSKPSKRLPTKHRKAEKSDGNSRSGNEATVQTHNSNVVLQPLRKPSILKTAATLSKQSQKPPVHQPLRSAGRSLLSAVVVPSTRREKIPEPTRQTKPGAKSGDPLQQSVATGKAPSRATTPALPTAKKQRGPNSISTSAMTKSVKKAAEKPSEALDMFDVPPSDEEEVAASRKPSRLDRPFALKDTSRLTEAVTSTARHDTAESDGSNASRKRKRKGSASSVCTVKPVAGRERGPSATQRSRKYPRKEESLSPRHESSNTTAIALPSLATSNVVHTISKPKKMRQRTVPVLLTKHSAYNAQSSPALLYGMLPERKQAKLSSAPATVESPAPEDETMYEFPDSLATPVRASNSVAPGSITPRQKALFTSLVGDASSPRNPMPSISKLQLTDRKPTALVGSLSRSRSDLTYSTQARKTRLIDSLKKAESSSEERDEESEDDGSISYDEIEKISGERGELHAHKQNDGHVDDSSTGHDSHHTKIDAEPVIDSQTSQTTSTFGTRQKLTYAKARSYLEEANPEDALLISMDLDDELGFDSQKKDSLSDDDLEPTSQVRAYHELKRRGQQYAFDNDVQMYIDDMPLKAGNTVRRSAILELSTKMADSAFSSQLLDSTWAQEFLRNVKSNGESIFDFATAAAITFMLDTNPSVTVLSQIHHNVDLATLIELASNDADIRRIAKDRKTNLSKIAQESVESLRAKVLSSATWVLGKPGKVSPQVVALKALESFIVGLRQIGHSEPLLDQNLVLKLIDLASKPKARLTSGPEIENDPLIMYMILSTLESDSVAVGKQPQLIWSEQILNRLANLVPVVFQPKASSSVMVAAKLCMNLSNNRPKACLSFSNRMFVQPLVASIVRDFGLVHADLKQEERTTIVERLLLCLGTMINLAELSDEARLNADDGELSVDKMVRIFIEGSERAAQAESIEEGYSGVAIGYLTVLLGNLCLNGTIRTKMQAQLPGQRFDFLIGKIKEFAHYHQHVDNTAKHFEGAEGQETWHNYTARLMLVVKKLEMSSA